MMSIKNNRTSQEIISVSLDKRSYEIHIGYGLMARAGGLIAPFLANKRTFVIADENALKHHQNVFLEALQNAHIAYYLIIIKSGEASKSFANFERVCEDLLEFGIDRGDVLIAFGGGVSGDLTGFVAGVLNRGLDFIQIPTTLLAQVDSSVGGKTAINAKAGKNLIGLFWQPKLVLADTQILETLEPRDIMAGFAEIFKIGLINDANFFQFCNQNHNKILYENGPERQFAIETAIRAKATIVEADEREGGVRALLNLGHSFGHAIEAGVNYDETILRHGEAVALGIAMAARFSTKIGTLGEEDCNDIVSFIKNCGYRYKLDNHNGAPNMFNAKAMLEAMTHDKKNSNGQINLILLAGIGKAFVHKNTDIDLLLGFLETECGPNGQTKIGQ